MVQIHLQGLQRNNEQPRAQDPAVPLVLPPVDSTMMVFELALQVLGPARFKAIRQKVLGLERRLERLGISPGYPMEHQAMAQLREPEDPSSPWPRLRVLLCRAVAWWAQVFPGYPPGSSL